MTVEPPDASADRSLPREDGAGPALPLSEAERAAAFTTGRTPVDRAAALRAGSVPVPRRFFFWVIIAFAVLGIGGIVAEKLIGNAGVGSLISSPVTTLAGTGPASGPGAGVSGGAPPPTQGQPTAPPVRASPSAVIGLTRLDGKPAPALSLTGPEGSPWTLAAARGKVVVLTFFNSECDDICPVLAQEITQADQLLGARSASVEFAVVNTDPLDTSIAPTPAALSQTGLQHLSNVTFLQGSLPELSAVWKRYGITVALDRTNRVITHNDAMDFIGPTGRLELGASPFADEDTLGIYSLQPATIHSFALGVADSARSLLGRTS